MVERYCIPQCRDHCQTQPYKLINGLNVKTILKTNGWLVSDLNYKMKRSDGGVYTQCVYIKGKYITYINVKSKCHRQIHKI